MLSKHFASTDFDCKCHFSSCTYTLVDTDLVEALEIAITIVGLLGLHSGFRCSAHNRAIGGKPGSMHMLGKAADVVSAKVSAKKVAALFETVPAFTNGGIGRYQTFTHADCRGYKARWEG